MSVEIDPKHVDDFIQMIFGPDKDKLNPVKWVWKKPDGRMFSLYSGVEWKMGKWNSVFWRNKLNHLFKGNGEELCTDSFIHFHRNPLEALTNRSVGIPSWAPDGEDCNYGDLCLVPVEAGGKIVQTNRKSGATKIRVIGPHFPGITCKTSSAMVHPRTFRVHLKEDTVRKHPTDYLEMSTFDHSRWSMRFKTFIR